MKNSLLIPTAIALAMGVAAIVLSILDQTESIPLLLAIAVFCLSIVVLNMVVKNE